MIIILFFGIDMMTLCPCGSHTNYSLCCGMYLSGQQSAPSPEKLMRSRFTAYYLKNMDYIAKTMKSPAADNFDAKDSKKWAEQIKWGQLKIIKTSDSITRGKVEFLVDYYVANKHYMMHEISEFKLVDGKWYYIDGTQLDNNA